MTYNRQSGLSLIELMIAIAIGLVLLAGVIQFFVANKQSSRVQTELSQVQENGRFAMQFISQDTRMSDFSGCLNTGFNDANDNINDASQHYSNLTHNVARGLDGINGNADPGDPGNGLDPNAALDSSDTLIIVKAAQTGVPIVAPFPTSPTDDIYLAPGHDLEQGDLVYIADCKKSDLFQITNDIQTAGYIRHTLGDFQDSAGNDYPGNKNTAPVCTATQGGVLDHCLGKTYDSQAIAYRLSSNTYDIQIGTNGLPALFRNDQELVPNIENMHVLYGEDNILNDNADSPTRYVSADAVTDMNNVVSIRVAIVAASEQDNVTTAQMPFTVFGDTTASNDNRIRRVFTSTLTLRNRRL